MDEQVATAVAIFKDFRARLKEPAFAKLSPSDQLTFYQRNHRAFMNAFPIPLRYMIEMRTFSAKAFRKYLRQLEARPIMSEDDYMRRQADYVKYLVMENNHNVKEAQQISNKVYESLKSESDAFKKAHAEIEAKIKGDDEVALKEKRAELKRILALPLGN